MLTGIYNAASALRTAERMQDVIATNLAHMNVPGFRRSELTVAAFDEQVDGATKDPGHGVAVEQNIVDFTEGPSLNSGRSLDVAIVGDGFFVVETDEGPLYTRNGVLHINPDGDLVNTSGFRIAGDRGKLSVPSDVTPSQIMIATDGTITANDTQIGKLKVVKFENNSELKQVGTTLFSTSAVATPVDESVQVMQGMREQSNVSPTDEMVGMILASRYHEAAQRTAKAINESIQQNTDPRS